VRRAAVIPAACDAVSDLWIHGCRFEPLALAVVVHARRRSQPERLLKSYREHRMPRISVKLAGDGTHMVVQDLDPVACGMSLDEAENFVTFLRVSARVRRTRRLPDAMRNREVVTA
jgi:hypothetical protein